MEIEFQDNKIIFNRVLSNLDKFALKFVKILDVQKIKYVIVSGYVAILFGRSRATEDVDLLVEKLDFERFVKLWDELSKSFDCINAVSASEAYHDYLENASAIRFALKDKFVPNVEFKFIKNDIEKFCIEHPVKVILNSSPLLISELELQIAFKLLLGSEKDKEDAVHLYKLFKNNLSEKQLIYWLNKLNIAERKKYLD